MGRGAAHPRPPIVSPSPTFESAGFTLSIGQSAVLTSIVFSLQIIAVRTRFSQYRVFFWKRAFPPLNVALMRRVGVDGRPEVVFWIFPLFYNIPITAFPVFGSSG